VAVRLVARAMDLGAIDLSGARFERLDLAGSSLAFSILDGIEVEDCELGHANLRSCRIQGATLRRVGLREAFLPLTWWDRSRIDACTFDGADLDRSSWAGAIVAGSSFRGAFFGNAALDDGTFVACDLTGADLSLVAPQPMGTSRGVRFERCRLEGTTWGGRDPADISIVDGPVPAGLAG
jgi:uncharacterized protein YjbI with pentapeptide repeats